MLTTLSTSFESRQAKMHSALVTVGLSSLLVASQGSFSCNQLRNRTSLIGSREIECEELLDTNLMILLLPGLKLESTFTPCTISRIEKPHTLGSVLTLKAFHAITVVRIKVGYELQLLMAPEPRRRMESSTYCVRAPGVGDENET